MVSDARVKSPSTVASVLPSKARRREIREAAGLSRRALSELIGCHEQSVVNWEIGAGDVGIDYLLPYLLLLAHLEQEALERAAREEQAATG